MEDNKLYPEQKEELTTVGEESTGQKEEQDELSAASGAGQEEQVASSATSGLSQEEPALDVRFGEQPDTAGMDEEHRKEECHEEALQPQFTGTCGEEAQQHNETYRHEVPNQNGGGQNTTPYYNSGDQNAAPYYNSGDQNAAPYYNGSDQNTAPYYNNHYQNTAAYQDNNYPNEQPYQGVAYPNNGYQNHGYYDNGQSTGYQGYQNYRNSQTAGDQSMGGQNVSCYNGAFSGTDSQNYDGGYQQYNGAQPYQNTFQNAYQNNGQMELEEPVKISEWVLAMVLMMIPCVNIIMMFVWAFSSTEKKSKSNFFKAYLIFFGISMGVMLLVWVAIVFFAMLSY